ncbi:MAG: hypothetical protein DHS20C14_08740 [Phycisphaeraceae bacterium]|nr:MAG: hypothetical protein DHS20C14_08740 [Phycisphaeraceae bacterium]
MKLPVLGKGASVSAIGLDIGARTIKAVQVRRRSGTPEVVAAIEFERSGEEAMPDQFETERIEGVLFRRGFVGNRLTIVVPREGVFYEEVDRPPRGRGVPEGQIIRSEIARVRRLEPDGFEQAWWDVPNESRRGSAGTAMVVGCERAPVLEAVERFERLGLEIVAVDGAMTALAGRLGAAGIAGDPFTVLVDLGWSAAAMAVVYQGVVVYQRQVEACGLEAVLGRIAKRMNVELDVADHTVRSLGSGIDGEHAGVQAILNEHGARVADEVQTSLTYAAHRFRKPAGGLVLLCGGGGELETIRARVAGTDGCEARVLRPGMFARFPGGGIRDLNSDCSSLTLATALAARFDR